MSNEKTIIENGSLNKGKDKNNKKENAWVNVTLGGVSGVLLGAGLMYAGQAHASGRPEADGQPQEPTPDGTEEGLTEAHVTDVPEGLSFADAFAAARAEVGPGGLFVWNGGVYGTYHADEWEAMTPAERSSFAHHANVSVSVDHIQVPTDDTPQVVVIPPTQDPEVIVVDPATQENFSLGDDVHVVGYDTVEGHLAVGYDTDGDGNIDVAIIDMDDDHQISNPDIIVHSDGDVVTVNDLLDDDADIDGGNDDAAEGYLACIDDNPDVAPDMPDYMNDATIEI